MKTKTFTDTQLMGNYILNATQKKKEYAVLIETKTGYEDKSVHDFHDDIDDEDIDEEDGESESLEFMVFESFVEEVESYGLNKLKVKTSHQVVTCRTVKQVIKLFKKLRKQAGGFEPFTPTESKPHWVVTKSQFSQSPLSVTRSRIKIFTGNSEENLEEMLIEESREVVGHFKLHLSEYDLLGYEKGNLALDYYRDRARGLPYIEASKKSGQYTTQEIRELEFGAVVYPLQVENKISDLYQTMGSVQATKHIHNRITEIEMIDKFDSLKHQMLLMSEYWCYKLTLFKRGEPFLDNTVLTLDVPSGNLLMSDTLSEVFVPTGEGEGQLAYLHNLAVRFCANSKVVTMRIEGFSALAQKDNGDYLLFDEDQVHRLKKDEHQIPLNRTGYYDYSVEMTDYQNWIDAGGREISHDDPDYTLLDVEAGTYQITIYSHSNLFYEKFFDEKSDYNTGKRIKYAKIERI